MPMYPITYIPFCVSLYFMGYTVVSIDSFFMGISIHATACLNDLSNLFTEIDQNPNCESQVSEHDHVRVKFIDCIKFHLEILDYIKTIGKFASPIIFGQYFISLMELCTLAFDVIMVKFVIKFYHTHCFIFYFLFILLLNFRTKI